ncbi:MAG: hypothetical protein JXQ29_18680 [Planctomycetes bacterium]|nr:hypothetical protein [Planctomycetota bacterium]
MPEREMATLNERIFDRFVRRAHAVERTKAGITRNAIGTIVNGFMGRLEERIGGRLTRLKSRGDVVPILKTKGYADLKDLIRTGMQKGFRGMQADLAEHMRELALQQSRFTLKVMGEEFAFDFRAQVPALGEFRRMISREPIAGKTLGQWFTGLARQGTDDTLRDLNVGLRQSETADEILARLTGRGGAFPRTLRAAETVVDTSLTHAADGGQRLALEANEEVVEEEQWSSILDDATCITCSSLDGQTFPLGEGPRPGEDSHPGCRCRLIPVIKSAKELGLTEEDLPEIERRAMDGDVPERTTYPEWLKSQPASVQNEVLGPTRGALFRSGKVPIDRMVDPRLRPLNLKDLAKREGIEIPRRGNGKRSS